MTDFAGGVLRADGAETPAESLSLSADLGDVASMTDFAGGVLRADDAEDFVESLSLSADLERVDLVVYEIPFFFAYFSV